MQKIKKYFKSKQRYIIVMATIATVILLYINRRTKIASSDITKEARIEKRFPDFLIFGARKSGTTTLQKFISKHPNARVVPGETEFFNKNYKRGIQWYRDKMPLAKPNDVVLEKTPDYFQTEAAPARVYQLIPNVRLILVVKDPVDRVISNYHWDVLNGIKRKNLTEEIFFINKTVKQDHEAVYVSFYDRYLTRWLKYFSIDKIHIIDGDQLLTDPSSVLSDVHRFMGLPEPYYTPANFSYNYNRGLYCFRKNASLLDAECMEYRRGIPHPKYPSWVYNELYLLFHPVVKRFSSMTGFQCSWCKRYMLL